MVLRIRWWIRYTRKVVCDQRPQGTPRLQGAISAMRRAFLDLLVQLAKLRSAGLGTVNGRDMIDSPISYI